MRSHESSLPPMRRLMLLRHAKTETDAPSGRDQDRRLDARGHRDAAGIGEWIGTHPPFPDHVMVSSAVRAVQTWDIAWEAMKEHAPLPLIGTADPASRQALSDNLPTSGLALFDFATGNWNDVAFRRGRLMLFVS